MRKQSTPENENSASTTSAERLETSVIVLGAIYFATLLALIVRLLP